ncbi:Gfo/Idh/MocA family protein [Saliphagus infecundisoli]|uniref:Gfo/Idh/MocA family protein n=1 Tax=Saliphagus infecundisoli TaxID=1849069 RepID=A0ABD5QCI4_9EURY|nr:Gfo/Idh/MocA family oxidoreductase [Saliphagus infecundisoli]
MKDANASVGVIGLGLMGTRHATNLEELGADIVAGTDIDSDARQKFEVKFSAESYASFERMYDGTNLDAVVITTPNKFHEPAALAALDDNVAVLCEKPLAHSLPAAERIAAADEQSDAFCMAGFKHRFGSATSLYKAYQQDGELGDLNAIEGGYVRRRGIPGLGSWFTSEEVAGGGALIDIGVHAIDYALYLAGYPEVIEVMGVTRNSFIARDNYDDPDDWAGKWDLTDESRDVDDSATVLMRCAGDLTISLEIAWAANREPDETFVVRGTDAGVRMDLRGDSLDIFKTGSKDHDHYSDTTLTSKRENDKLCDEDLAFLQGVYSDKRPSMNTIDEALQVQRIIAAIYRSSDQDSSIVLENDELRPTTAAEQR